jgi:glyoxylase-like metal-dependent hydrolase (beta-lactamase superfamily II)
MVDSFQIGSTRNFVYLITQDGESLVVDPQLDLKPWENKLNEIGAKLKGVLLTHTHFDHIGGVPSILEKYQVPIYVHALDARRLKHIDKKHLSFIEDSQKISIGNTNVEVLHTPGHSAGECCFLICLQNALFLFTGDTIFVGDVGRTDLETGSTQDLFYTLERIKSLPLETVFYPGHDYGKTPTTTLVHELKHSLAFQCKSVEELDALP